MQCYYEKSDDYYCEKVFVDAISTMRKICSTSCEKILDTIIPLCNLKYFQISNAEKVQFTFGAAMQDSVGKYQIHFMGIFYAYLLLNKFILFDT